MTDETSGALDAHGFILLDPREIDGEHYHGHGHGHDGCDCEDCRDQQIVEAAPPVAAALVPNTDPRLDRDALNLIEGTDGRDDIKGTSGSDYIVAGAGSDFYVRGGAGADTFEVNLGDGVVRIADFALGEDVIALESQAVLDAARITEGNGRLDIRLEDGTLIRIDKLAAEDVEQAVIFRFVEGEGGANGAPVVSAIDAGEISEDAAPVTIDLLSGASDPDGDPLSVEGVTATAASGAEVQFDIAGGSVTIDPDQFGAALGAGESETVTFLYGVSDGRGGVTSNSATLVVTGEDEPVLASFVSGGEAATSYNVEVVFEGDWTVELQAAFVSAAEWISSIVTGDVADAFYGGREIDDISITATLAPIDGSGGTLGFAGPSVIRSASYLPVLGEMTFDTADAENMLAAGTWEDVIFHEMMHTLGFGTLWEYMGLVDDYGGDLRFNGANATAAYNDLFADIASVDALSAQGVPIETDGGQGTAGGHWDEETFGSEVMTGYIDNPNYLSDMTVAALEDMGYETVWDDMAIA